MLSHCCYSQLGEEKRIKCSVDYVLNQIRYQEKPTSKEKNDLLYVLNPNQELNHIQEQEQQENRNEKNNKNSEIFESNLRNCFLKEHKKSNKKDYFTYKKGRKRNDKRTSINEHVKMLGVYYRTDKKKFRARTSMNGKKEDIGLFNTREEAARAYDQKIIQFYGKEQVQKAYKQQQVYGKETKMKINYPEDYGFHIFYRKKTNKDC